MKAYDHTFIAPVSKGSAAIPLRFTVKATYDNDGSLDDLTLAINEHVQSDKNRELLLHMLNDPVVTIIRRDEVSGDYIGAKWSQHPALNLHIWTRDYTWILSRKQAKVTLEEFYIALGSFERNERNMKAQTTLNVVAPDQPDERDAQIAKLEQENKDLRAMVRFLEQYRP